MAPEQYQQAKTLFLRARELESAKLPSFLDEHCGGDNGLRAGVEELLEHDRRPMDFGQGAGIRSALDGILEEEQTESSRAHEPEVVEHPERIGNYRICELLGEGGFGVVYAAEQTAPIHREVALKIIKAGMDTRRVIARFEAERQILALMNHANIARVFDAGATDTGRPYFVMERVHGEAITDYCDQNNLTTRERLHLFLDVCQAVQHAHQKGVIHRDLKPSNVLVTLQDDQPVPKVIDFGIAKATEQRQAEKTMFTEFGQLIGTPEYMSPEQAEMNESNIDTRSDIYSLGVLLYELLSGTTPFERERLRSASYSEIQRIIREEEPPRPSTRVSRLGADAADIAARRKVEIANLVKSLRGDLDWIIMKALEKDRTRRYETVNGLAMDIRRHLNNEPVIAGPPGAGYRIRKFVRRNRGGVIAGTLVAAALVTGLTLSVIGLVQARIAQQSEQQKSEELRYQLYVSQIERISRIIETNAADPVKAMLAQCDEDLRGWEWDRLNWLADRSETTIQSHEGPVHVVEYSSDGTRFLTAGAGGVVRIWDANTQRLLLELRVLQSDRTVLTAKFSNNGALVVAGNDQGFVHIWQARTGELVRSIDVYADGRRAVSISDAYHVLSLALDPLASRLLIAPRYGVPKAYDVASGRRLFELDKITSAARAMSFTRDGLRILVASNEGYISLSSAADGAILLAERGGEDVIWDGAFSPDEQRIASLGSESRLWMREVETGELLFKARFDNQAAHTMAFHPAGGLVAVGGVDGNIALLNAGNGEQVISLRGHEAGILDLSFHPGGKYLLSAATDGTVKRWHLGVGRHRATYKHDNHLHRVCFAPDGKSIVFGGALHGLMRLDVGTLTVEKSEAPLPYIMTIAVSLDGLTAVTAFNKHVDGYYVAAMLDRDFRVLHQWQFPHWRRLAFSPDGRRLLSPNFEGGITVWDVTSGQKTLTIPTEEDPDKDVVFSSDGRQIISAHASGMVRLWDAATGRALSSYEAHPDKIEHLRLVAGGNKLITYGMDKVVRLWDWRRHELLLTLTDCGAVRALAVSPDGKRLATAADDLTIRLWDLERGMRIMTVGRHTGPITDLAFSPDGSTIASTSQDMTLSLWESSPPHAGLEERFTGSVGHRLGMIESPRATASDAE